MLSLFYNNGHSALAQTLPSDGWTYWRGWRYYPSCAGGLLGQNFAESLYEFPELDYYLTILLKCRAPGSLYLLVNLGESLSHCERAPDV